MAEINKKTEETEIDLLELAKKLWDNKKFIIKCSIVGLIVGVVIAFSIPKEYTSTVILATESSKSTGASMGALASMAGINLGGGGGSDDVFSPELYPNVLNSTPFIKGLFDVKVTDSKQDINTALYDYFESNQKLAWWSYILKAPGLIIGLFTSDSEIESSATLKDSRYISLKEMNIIDAIKGTYNISTDKKTGVTTLEAMTQSPAISAYLADTLTSYLQSYIIEQRTKKAKTDLANSGKLYTKAKNDYYKAQQDLASFVDANKHIASAKRQIDQKRLEEESSIAFQLYNQMAQQVQMNEIKIQDDTPVFTVIQPAIEPLFPEKPKKKIIVIILVFLSGASACAWILSQNYIQKFKY